MDGCSKYTISTQGSVGFDLGDARLIAAAPELLEALQDLCDTLGECGMTEKARAAIANVAEGSSAAIRRAVWRGLDRAVVAFMVPVEWSRARGPVAVQP